MPGLFDNIKHTVESVVDEVTDAADDAAAAVASAVDSVADDLGGAVPDGDLPELTLPTLTSFDVLRIPAPLGPIPLPYPNLAGFDAPELPDLPDPGPLTISAPHVGKGSMVPAVGAQDVLLGDPESVDLPDLRIGDDDGGLFVDIDPIVPGTPTAHGGVLIGGVEVDATIDAPGAMIDTDGEIVVIVDPMVTGLVPHVGGAAAGGDTTIDLQPDDLSSFDPPSFDPPSFDTPTIDPPSFDDDAQDSAPDDFESTIDTIDDTAEQFDIFD